MQPLDMKRQHICIFTYPQIPSTFKYKYKYTYTFPLQSYFQLFSPPNEASSNSQNLEEKFWLKIFSLSFLGGLDKEGNVLKSMQLIFNFIKDKIYDWGDQMQFLQCEKTPVLKFDVMLTSSTHIHWLVGWLVTATFRFSK